MTRKLVVEKIPEASNRVGRPSPVVAANPRVVALAVNPEIDAITVGIVGLDSTVHHRVRYPLSDVPTAAEAVAITARVIEGLRSSLSEFERTVGVGVAVPGLVRSTDGMVRLAPHLEWIDEPIVAMLGDATGMPTAAANDARLGANAERLFGAGRDAADLVYVNGGASGIGGGLIVNGVPLGGADGYAGEIGHTQVRSGGRDCHCGATGCLETEVSQSALLGVLREAGADIESGDLPALDDALRRSDSDTVRREIDRQLGFLAVALRNVTNLINPKSIVLGGFLGPLLDASGGRLAAVVAATSLAASAESLAIERAQLGADALMIGAAELAFGTILADPTS